MTRTLLAHDADLRAELVAVDEEELYAEAVALLRELLVGASPVAEREERRVEIVAADEAERFFRFVRELVYLADAESFLPASVRRGREVHVRGERFDSDRHVAEHQIKAATRHAFRFRRSPGAIRVQLVFDL